MVSIINVTKGCPEGPFELDGRHVDLITAYLFHAGGNENPYVLSSNASLGFIGNFVLGMGFTFDDLDKKGVASSLAEMRQLIAKDRANAERIFPYLGGEEVNENPNHLHNRFVINFNNMPEKDARRWPDLIQIVEERVRPERRKVKRARLAQYWWQFAELQPKLQAALAKKKTALVASLVTKHLSFAFVPTSQVFSHKLVVFPVTEFAFFAILQSSSHNHWARFFSSTLEDRLNYSPSDCFETFPFPPDWESNTALEVAGREYYEYRAALMVRNEEGLTKTYNRFHDPEERSPDIHQLRTLHAAMDRAVLAAYGWPDIPTACEFLLDYEEEEDAEDTPEAPGKKKGKKKKKPYRYRWPDEVRDEVLAKLLALNAERAEQERLSGTTKKTPKKTTTSPTGTLQQTVMQRPKAKDEMI